MGVRKSEKEYVFKVNVKGLRRIWRTIALRGDQTLEDLHEVIFAAFDRFDPHLYSFYFPKARPRRGPGPPPKEYTTPEMIDELGPLDDDMCFDAAETRLDDIQLSPGQQFEYLFDFGDSWWHEVLVEEINRVVRGAKYPQIREKRGTSPPQYEVIDE